MTGFQLNTVWLMTLLVLQGLAMPAYARDFDAALDWTHMHSVNFPFDGAIKQVHVRAGEKVSKGTKLVELDTEPIAIRVRQHEAEVAAARPVLADAERAYEQARSLYEQTVLSDDELLRARHAFDKAGAELAAARVRLDYARWQLNKASAVAPWDAWVVRRDAESGQMLVAEQRSKPLLLLAKSGSMAATAFVPVSALDAIRVGQAAKVSIEDKTVSASVAAVSLQSGVQHEARYRVDVVFDVADGDVFWAGQAARISLR